MSNTTGFVKHQNNSARIIEKSNTNDNVPQKEKLKPPEGGGGAILKPAGASAP
jgi:hypothetical protein